MVFEYSAAAVFGLVVGSFLNVCIYRLPRGLSVVSPPSSCPSCSTPIRPYHNIPVVSYILLGGRCAYCKARVSPVYPAVELVNALLYLAAVYRFGFTAKAAVVMLLMSAFVVVFFIDLRHRIIPNSITYPGIALSLLLGPLFMGTTLADSALGVLAGGGLLLAVGFLGGLALGVEGMGGGDIKLMAMVGGFLGWKPVLLSIFIGAFLGSVIGIGLIAAKVIARRTPIPFGPFLVVGAAVSVFFGNDIIGWYGGAYYLPPHLG